ncbi:hypothetical protein [Halobacterium rubrum]|uniref:hypothetical protein n=1 Tax=Halobacterium TaxID=2239 RepID=UPI001F399429|nr:hypothetical protein [Halobacterium rubrum]MDH5019932.1 hypothetical protein [Halobacterium rubrum]
MTDGADETDDLRALHDHLAATGERPVDRTASHYLGEAEAVVADALAPDAGEDVARKRVEQARELLSNVDGTGDDAADEHVAAARTLCDRVLGDV